MTTAFAHATAGDPLASVFTQPFGALLAILTAATLIGGLHAAATGIRVDRLLRPLRGKWLLIAGGASILAAWVYKMMTWN
jgi:hypothetical protein